jgi:hypothetical protein
MHSNNAQVRTAFPTLILGTRTSPKKHKSNEVEQDISDGTQQKLFKNFFLLE